MHLNLLAATVQGHTLAFDKVIILTSACYCGQGTTLVPTTGNPTPNGLRSSWDFLLGISLDTLASLAP